MVISSRLSCFLICIILLSCLSCSNGIKYRGYIPATQEEAESFGKELETAINGGDKALLWDATTDIDASGAIYTFRGLDVPANVKNTSNETRSQYFNLMKNRNAACFKIPKSTFYFFLC